MASEYTATNVLLCVIGYEGTWIVSGLENDSVISMKMWHNRILVMSVMRHYIPKEKEGIVLREKIKKNPYVEYSV